MLRPTTYGRVEEVEPGVEGAVDVGPAVVVAVPGMHWL